MNRKVLIVGGAGHFGRLLAEDLHRHIDCEIVIVDRTSANLFNPASVEGALSGVAVAICVAGPFQELPTTLAESCLRLGIHYIDFADDRHFVRKIHSLVDKHQNPQSAVCTAWSTVSALSALLTHIAARSSGEIDEIYIHMAPGNRLPRGAGTIASFLHSVGTPFTICRHGQWQTALGWSAARDYLFPAPIGRRRGYLVDVPDHEFFPELFEARTVEFRTSSELQFLNMAVSSLAWFVKRGLVRSWTPWARAFQAGTALFAMAGHDWGGVGVEVYGSKLHRRASVVADSGGQSIAVMPAAIMTEMLLAESKYAGRISPVDWLAADPLSEACAMRGFRLIVEDL
jgi:saccharopine dehydrogenase-like NADP-dependent oxidoreductase